MMNIIHVVLNYQGGWNVQNESDNRVFARCDEKEQAITAHQISMNSRQSFYIHNEDGSLGVVNS